MKGEYFRATEDIRYPNGDLVAEDGQLLFRGIYGNVCPNPSGNGMNVKRDPQKMISEPAIHVKEFPAFMEFLSRGVMLPPNLELFDNGSDEAEEILDKIGGGYSLTSISRMGRWKIPERGYQEGRIFTYWAQSGDLTGEGLILFNGRYGSKGPTPRAGRFRLCNHNIKSHKAGNCYINAGCRTCGADLSTDSTG